MAQQPIPVMPPPTRPPGPSFRLSLAIGAVGLVIAVVSVVAIVIPLIGTYTSSAYAVPGELDLHLHHMRYTVYQRTDVHSAFDLSPSGSTLRIAPSAVSVVAPDGSSVPVTFDAYNETLTRGSATYTGSLVFDAPTTGVYRITFANPVPTTVIVARSIRDAIRSVVAWFFVGAFGGALLVTGVVMLIVGATRRGRARRAAYAGWGAPPGTWYGPNAPQWAPPGGGPPPGYPPPGYPPPPPAYPPPPPAPAETPPESREPGA